MWLWLNNTPPGNAWPFWLRARLDDRRRRLAGQAGRFLLIGVISTVAYVLLYLLLRLVDEDGLRAAAEQCPRLAVLRAKT